MTLVRPPTSCRMIVGADGDVFARSPSLSLWKLLPTGCQQWAVALWTDTHPPHPIRGFLPPTWPPDCFLGGEQPDPCWVTRCQSARRAGTRWALEWSRLSRSRGLLAVLLVPVRPSSVSLWNWYQSRSTSRCLTKEGGQVYFLFTCLTKCCLWLRSIFVRKQMCKMKK